MVALGKWQLTSWWYFICKVRDFNQLIVLWSMFGVMLINVVLGFAGFNLGRLLKAWGNLKGFVAIFSGKALEKTGFNK